LNQIDFINKSTINYGGIDLEVYKLSKGSYTLSQTQVGQSINNSENSLRYFLDGKSSEAASVEHLTTDVVSIGQGAMLIKAP
jgi:hypothetical protein